MPPPPRSKPPLKTSAKAPPKTPPPTPLEQLKKLAATGYVDVNDAATFIKELKAQKPGREALRTLKNELIRHMSVCDRGAFHKIKTFCETYRAENDID